MTSEIDVRSLARELVSRRSVTPDDGGCLDLVAEILAQVGFVTERMDAEGVSNLWALWGDSGKLAVFSGHVDVVPPGEESGWKTDPFSPEERDGNLYGRGACDMKGSVAAMVCAACSIVAQKRIQTGRIGILLTSDEEGPAIHGTDHVVNVLAERGVEIDHCLVGEPTSAERFGDTVKNGRRGTLNARLTLKGRQGHSAYPDRTDNAAHRALLLLAGMVASDWDNPSRDRMFSPTSFQVTDFHSGVGTTNVVPGEARIIFDVRYAPPDTRESIIERIEGVLEREAGEYACEWLSGAVPYLSSSDTLLARSLCDAILEHTGTKPAFSTAGGTSDGRFLQRISKELIEFGPLSGSMHQYNEHVAVDDLARLNKIYEHLICKILL